VLFDSLYKELQMNFETITAKAKAHPNYSQILLQVGRTGESIGKVIDLIDLLGGDIIGLDVFTVEDDQKILRIMLSNDRVSDIVWGLVQEGYLKATGFGRSLG
jgi:hypothetical protein